MTNNSVSDLGKAINQLSIQILSKTSSTSSTYELNVQVSATGQHVSQHSEAGYHRIEADHHLSNFHTVDVQEQTAALQEEEERRARAVGLGISIQQHDATGVTADSIHGDSQVASHRQQTIGALEGTAGDGNDAPRSTIAAPPTPSDDPTSIADMEHGYPSHAPPSPAGSHGDIPTIRTCKPHGHVDRRGLVFAYPSPPLTPAVETPGSVSNSSAEAPQTRKQHGHQHRYGIADFTGMRFSTDDVGNLD